MLANGNAAPYVANMFSALAHVDRIPGVERALARIASACGDSEACGYSFEIIAGAGLQKRARTADERVAAFDRMIDGHQVDILLGANAQATKVEVKSLPSARNPKLLATCVSHALTRAEAQLTQRCAGGKPAMLVIPPLYNDPTRFAKMAQAIGTPFSVITVDPATCSTRKIYDSTAQPNSALRNATWRCFGSGRQIFARQGSAGTVRVGHAKMARSRPLVPLRARDQRAQRSASWD